MDMSAGGDGESMDVGGLLLRFVNTRPILHPDDDLADAVSVGHWLLEEGLIGDETLVTEADASVARELRSALVTVLKAHVGLEDPAEDRVAQEVLDRAAAAHPLAPKIAASGARFVPSQQGTAGALGAVLADAATAALDEKGWRRFKACKNPICYRGFHDNSRPASAIYCSHSCASQVGMRAYRARKANV
jgi:predicted RNA-binding Zn ribbon-like protein